MNICPDCKCGFVQPFKCITCGAQKLYDVTVISQAKRIAFLEDKIKDFSDFADAGLPSPMHPAVAELIRIGRGIHR
jgi:hypothetical protein